MRVRVLIADADQDARSRSRADLLAEGFDIITAVSGLDCLFRLRDAEPNVLVMDPRLLWGSGEGVLALLRERRDLPQVSVLILTDLREVSLSSPVFRDCAVLGKPAQRATLALVVRALATKGRRRIDCHHDVGCNRE